MEVINYCTLFDSNYALQGLALLKSLIKTTGKDFHLFILALDEEIEEILIDFGLKNDSSCFTLLHLYDFERLNPDLLLIKDDRSRAEYCWTITPFLIRHCLRTYEIKQCIYLDADLYFFNSANDVWNIRKPKSIIFLTEHNYFPTHDTSFYTGRYNVQYVGFSNDFKAFEALDWWCDACFTWCYARMEDNKFGDQKYLDGWVNMFSGVYVSTDFGHGVAPWNVERFNFCKLNRRIELVDLLSGSKSFMTFYHFHGFRAYSNGFKFADSKYLLSNFVISEIYEEYIKEVNEIRNTYNIKLMLLNHYKIVVINFLQNIYALALAVKYFSKYNLKNYKLHDRI